MTYSGLAESLKTIDQPGPAVDVIVIEMSWWGGGRRGLLGSEERPMLQGIESEYSELQKPTWSS